MEALPYFDFVTNQFALNSTFFPSSNRLLMTSPKGKSELFPERSLVRRGEAEGNIDVRGEITITFPRLANN